MNGQRTNPFPGSGEMGARIQAFDWEQTSVGAVASWPQSLKSTVRTLLGSRYPMILLWGQELIQIYNDAYINLIGDKHPGALGHSIRATQAESWDIIGPMITKVMTTGVPLWVEDQMLAVNRAGYNEEAHFSLSYSAVENDAGQISGMLCVCSEITQQVLGERRLRLQRDLGARASQTRSVTTTCRDILAAIAEHPLDLPFALLYLRDPDGKTLRRCGTVRLEDLEGLEDQDAIAPAFVSLTDSLTEPTEFWPWATAMAGQTAEVENLDHNLTLPGGPWGEPVRQAVVLPIASSTVTAPLGVLIAGVSPNHALDDAYQSFYQLLAGQVSVCIRNAQAYEEECRRAELLAEIDRAKTAFFWNISHEFRTPLTLMLGPLEDVLQSPTLQPAEREHIAVARRNSLRLLKLVNTLLDFSRLEAGRIQAVYEPTDLAALTTDLASVFRSAIEKAGLAFRVECAPLGEPAYVDRDMWEKIVFNLLSNAFKFTHHGQIALSLRLVAENIELEVVDTGSGIPESELDNVFKRFYRIEGTQGRTYEGSGIGLSLVQELVQLHGGTIQVQSVEGQGSRFRVTLPRGQEHLPADQIGGDRTLASTTIRRDVFVEEALQWINPDEPTDPDLELEPVVSSESRSRILLADDNADMRDYVRKLLSPQYDVIAVPDGEAALAVAQAQMPDLVLSDVMMPKLDGFGLVARLRSNPGTRSLPIILLSARAGEDSRVEGLEAGADDYLVKPFSARELLARVKATLETAQLRQESARFRQSLQVEQSGRTLAETAQEQAAFLSRVSEVLSSSLDYEQTLQSVADLAVPYFADWCGVDLLNEDCSIGRVAVAHSDPERVKWAWEIARQFPRHLDDGYGISQVIKTGQPEIAPEIPEELLAASIPNPDYLRIIQSLGLKSCIIAPLTARGRVLGSISFVLSDSERRYSTASLTLAQDLARRAAIAIDNARLFYATQQAQQTAEIAADRTARLQALTAALSESLTPLQVTEVIVEQSLAALKADSLLVALLTEDRTELEIYQAIGYKPDLVEEWRRFSVEMDVPLAEAVRTGEPAWEATPAERVARYPHLAEIYSQYEFNSWVSLPLMAEGSAVGGIQLSFKEFKRLEQDDRNFMLALSRQCAQAISRAQLYEAERKARAAAEQANRLKDEFLAVLSHELRSPLNPILGWSRLLQTRPLDAQTTAQALATIERNAKLQSELIEDLLDVSRILQGKLNLNIAPVNLATITAAAIETVRLAAEAKSIEIQTSLDSTVGQVLGDANRLQQVVWNLLSNAVKFTPQGGQVAIGVGGWGLGDGEIGVRDQGLGDGELENGNEVSQDTSTLPTAHTQPPTPNTQLLPPNTQPPTPNKPTHVQLTVTDTGQGISPEFLPHVFDYFRQADSATTRRFGGLGLGLAIVRHLVELHGGTVCADSLGTDQGSTFTVRLPLLQAEFTEPESVDLAAPATLMGLRVLVVDDEADNRDFYQFVLEQFGAIAIAVGSAEKAFQALADSKFDILLSDIGMPNVDGYMLIQQIRAWEHKHGAKTMPAIALTAYAGEVDQQRALTAGFQQHLAKPVEPEALVQAISLCRN